MTRDSDTSGSDSGSALSSIVKHLAEHDQKLIENLRFLAGRSIQKRSTEWFMCMLCELEVVTSLPKHIISLAASLGVQTES